MFAAINTFCSIGEGYTRFQTLTNFHSLTKIAENEKHALIPENWFD